MRTFHDYCNLREGSALTVGKDVFGNTSLGDDAEENMSEIFQMVRVAMRPRNRSLLWRFLNTLAKRDDDARGIMSQINQRDLNRMGSKATRGMKFGATDDPTKAKDVLQLPQADSASGEMP